jgi:hypothetical protein
VRRGSLDLGTAAELLEHQVSARMGLFRLIAPAATAASQGRRRSSEAPRSPGRGRAKQSAVS